MTIMYAVSLRFSSLPAFVEGRQRLGGQRAASPCGASPAPAGRSPPRRGSPPPSTAPCAGQIFDDRGSTLSWRSAEELDQHGFQQGLVGRLDRDDGERAQARAQVGQRELEIARGRARGQQHRQPAFARAVQQVKQRPLVARSRGRDPRRRARCRRAVRRQRRPSSAAAATHARRGLSRHTLARWLLPEPLRPDDHARRDAASRASGR